MVSVSLDCRSNDSQRISTQSISQVLPSNSSSFSVRSSGVGRQMSITALIAWLLIVRSANDGSTGVAVAVGVIVLVGVMFAVGESVGVVVREGVREGVSVKVAVGLGVVIVVGVIDEMGVFVDVGRAVCVKASASSIALRICSEGLQARRVRMARKIEIQRFNIIRSYDYQ